MSNKSKGTEFEREFAQQLFEHGFWVHLLQDNRNGQPFDVIAAKDGRTYVFDCKYCQCEDFSLYRIEKNQELAMRLWQECGNHEGLFALKTPSGVYILSYMTAMELIDSGVKRLRGKRIIDNTISFREWVQ